MGRGTHCRLQKLMGHASAIMTLRYVRHAPESYFAEDAAKIAASSAGWGIERRRQRSPWPARGSGQR